MNESSWNKRTLSNRAARRVAYSFAAGASVASTAVDAEAAIHYYYGDISIPQGSVQSLDVNIEGDDYDDILLKNYVFPNGNYQGAIVPYATGKLVGFTAGLQYVTALTAGAIIDATTRGPSFVGSLAYGASNPNAQFNAVSDAFIGFAFPIGQTNLYNAWVRVDVNNAAGTFVVKDWAYEDQLGVGIAAGDVGLLPIQGDLNGDRRVNGRDFLKWQREFGTTYTVFDLKDWQQNYGGGLPLTASINAVPEPGTLGLLAAGALGIAALRKRSRPRTTLAGQNN